MIAARSLDTGDTAVKRPDWAQMKQRRRVQVKNDIETTEKRQKGKYKNGRSLVDVLGSVGAFGAEAPLLPGGGAAGKGRDR